MNYTDFGVKGPEELEQDEWSLTRPTFETPRGGLLTVMGVHGRKWKKKQYVVQCSICKMDHEMFQEGLFLSGRQSLGRSTPCGCSNRYLRTEEQYILECRRESEAKNLIFKGLAETYNGCFTRITLLCPSHGVWDTYSLRSLKKKGVSGCPFCGYQQTGRKLRQSTEDLKKQFSKNFPAGTAFTRYEKDRWVVTCGICSNDEYVGAGLCSGKFESTTEYLKKGHRPCRCSTQYVWSSAQREYQIRKEMEARSLVGEAEYKFIGWVNGHATRSKFKYCCSLHGEKEITISNFLFGQGCGECSGQSQCQAYIHQVKDRDSVAALKFGIAAKWEKRLSIQNYKNLFQSENIGVWMFKSVKACRAAELECKQTLKTGVLSVREMKDGWTETVSTLDIEKVIAIYEKHGGVRIK